MIDSVIPDGQQLDTFREALSPDRLRFVVLDPGTAVCQYRNEIRPPADQDFFEGHDGLRASMRHGLGHVGWWFDTSDLDPQQTAQQILDESSDRAAPHR